MGLFGDNSDEAKAYDEYNGKHKTEVSHQLLAAAASYAAAREFDKHCAANGKPQSHAEAKELLAAFAGAFVDREVETHGMDFIDKEKAKYDAHKAASEAAAKEY